MQRENPNTFFTDNGNFALFLWFILKTMVMKKYLVLLLLCCMSVLKMSARTDSLLIRDTNDSIRVSLVTCSPGTEVYAVYGHTALRVEVPTQGIDVAINYGLFMFDAPNFIWKFIKGDTDYVVGALNYPIFEREYTERGSSVTLQELNLTEAEKVDLIHLLNNNLRPENRTYRYNFLYNNCSTKARDKVEEALKIVPTCPEKPDTTITYRSIIHQYTAEYPWMQFGIDYLLGIEADRPIAAREQMFAPQYLQEYTAATQLIDTGQTYPYVVDERVVAPLEPQPATFTFMLTPIQMMILLLLLTACICTLELLIERRQWWFDVLLLTVQGLMGCIVAFLFFFSEHPTVGSNLHLIYLNPLPLLFIPFVVGRKKRNKSLIFNGILVGMLATFVVVTLFSKQYIQPAAYLFVATLLLRVVHNEWLYSKLSHLLARRKPARQRGIHLTVVLLTLCTAVPTQSLANNDKVPKAVISIVVDQLRADYLEKYAHLYGDNGFKRLFAEGRVYTNGYFSHANPDRSSATASVYSGSTPYYHGITANHHLDRKTLKVIGATDDAAYKGVNTSVPASPARLLVTTIADELKIASKGNAYVCSIAPERDMAILAGGHGPNAVMWLDEEEGLWATSSYYNGLPAWTRSFNRRKDSQFDWNDMAWEPYFPTGLYSASAYGEAAESFRHTFKGGDPEAVRRYKTSANVNDEVTRLALACIDNNLFGRNKTTDMLCVGYYAGNYEHASEWERPIELQDIYLRLDHNIAELLNAINEKIGLENALIVITSTGYADAHLPDIKFFTLPTGELKMDRCRVLLNMYLGAIYGTGEYVEASYLNEIYLNHDLIEKKQFRMKELLDRCTEFLSQMSGVKRVYSSLGLFAGSADPAMQGAYNSASSGDLILEVSPGWTLVDELWNKDIYYNRAHIPVPIIFYGAGFTPETSRTPITIESIAPTIAHILRISAPNACSERPIQ